jgi:hypothetical protein
LIRIYTTSLLLVLLAPFAYKSYLVADYVILKDYYATELCVNKNDATKNCNGLCQLNKELSNTSDQNENPPINLEEINITQFIVPEFFFVSRFEASINKRVNVFYSFSYQIDFNFKTLKPPKNFC